MKSFRARSYPLYIAIVSFCLLLSYVRIIRNLKMEHHMHTHNQQDHSGNTSSSHGGDMMMMPMWFQATIDTVLWLEPWHTTSWPAYIAALLGLILFGIIHEYLASYRVRLTRAKPAPLTQSYSSPLLSEENPAMAGEGPIADLGSMKSRAYSSLLYACNLATGYLLMLAVMTYNVGFFFAVVSGMGLGHFLCFTMPWHRHHVRMDSCCETLSHADD